MEVNVESLDGTTPTSNTPTTPEKPEEVGGEDNIEMNGQ